MDLPDELIKAYESAKAEFAEAVGSRQLEGEQPIIPHGAVVILLGSNTDGFQVTAIGHAGMSVYEKIGVIANYFSVFTE